MTNGNRKSDVFSKTFLFLRRFLWHFLNQEKMRYSVNNLFNGVDHSNPTFLL
jgi:hypothetical protein